MLSRRFIDKTWPVCLLVLFQGLSMNQTSLHSVYLTLFLGMAHLDKMH
jgi:hypothetical protein